MRPSVHHLSAIDGDGLSVDSSRPVIHEAQAVDPGLSALGVVWSHLPKKKGETEYDTPPMFKDPNILGPIEEAIARGARRAAR